ncbi:MAG: response regulator transcription factor [Phycicoccus sp.]
MTALPAPVRPRRVLLLDEDRDGRESVRHRLAGAGYTVRTARDESSAWAAATVMRPDAVVLDLCEPRSSGMELCLRLRADGDDVPVLVTAHGTVADRVTGLDAGADDFLPKPFAAEELLARVRALLRRSRADDRRAREVLVYDDLRLDLGSRIVARGETVIDLTRTEHALLELFMRHPDEVLTRQRLLADVWGYDFDPGSNTLDVYVGYLRRKTEVGDATRVIQNVRGVGYVLRTETAAYAAPGGEDSVERGSMQSRRGEERPRHGSHH